MPHVIVGSIVNHLIFSIAVAKMVPLEASGEKASCDIFITCLSNYSQVLTENHSYCFFCKSQPIFNRQVKIPTKN